MRAYNVTTISGIGEVAAPTRIKSTSDLVWLVFAAVATGAAIAIFAKKD